MPTCCFSLIFIILYIYIYACIVFQWFDFLLFCIVHSYRLALIFPLWSYVMYIQYISVCNCSKDRLNDRHLCLNFYPCVIKFNQSINQSIYISLSLSALIILEFIVCLWGLIVCLCGLKILLGSTSPYLWQCVISLLNFHEFFLCLFFLCRVFLLVWVPLLCQPPVTLLDLCLACRVSQSKHLKQWQST